jgi:hypothetical protein
MESLLAIITVVVHVDPAQPAEGQVRVARSRQRWEASFTVRMSEYPSLSLIDLEDAA